MGRTIYSFTYNDGKRIASVTDIAGRTIKYEYEPTGDLKKVIADTQTIWTYTYNSYHGMTSKANGLNETYTMEYQYPDRGVVKRIVDPVGTELMKIGQPTTGHEMTLQYDFRNRVFYYTNYAGLTFKNITNTNSEVLYTEEIADGVVTPTQTVEITADRTYKTTDALGNVSSIQRDEWGNVIKKVDEAGYIWRYVYDNDGRPLTVTDPLGTMTKYEYDSFGNMTKQTLAAGTNDESATIYTYTQYSELQSITNDSSTYSAIYDQAGNIVEIKDPIGNRTNITWDLAGNRLTITWPLIGTTTYADYDYIGNRGKETDPNGNVIVYAYDVLGRVKTITNQADNSTTQYSYTTTSGSCRSCGSGGGTGNIERVVLPEGNQISYSNDSSVNVYKISDYNGNSINYSFNAMGKRTKAEIKDIDGIVQRRLDYEYDNLKCRSALNIDPASASNFDPPRTVIF